MVKNNLIFNHPPLSYPFDRSGSMVLLWIQA